MLTFVGLGALADDNVVAAADSVPFPSMDPALLHSIPDSEVHPLQSCVLHTFATHLGSEFFLPPIGLQENIALRQDTQAGDDGNTDGFIDEVDGCTAVGFGFDTATPLVALILE